MAEKKCYIKVPRWLIHDAKDRKLLMTYIYLYRRQNLEHQLTTSIYHIVTGCKYYFTKHIQNANLNVRNSIKYMADNGLIKTKDDISTIQAKQAFSITLLPDFYDPKQYVILTYDEMDAILNYTGNGKKETLIHAYLYIKSYINLGKGRPHAFWGTLGAMSKTLGLSYNTCLNVMQILQNMELIVTYDDLTLSWKTYKAPVIYAINSLDARQNCEEATAFLKKQQAIAASMNKHSDDERAAAEAWGEV